VRKGRRRDPSPIAAQHTIRGAASYPQRCLWKRNLKHHSPRQGDMMIKEGHARIFLDSDGELRYEYREANAKQSSWGHILLDAVSGNRDFVQWERNQSKPSWAIDAGTD